MSLMPTAPGPRPEASPRRSKPGAVGWSNCSMHLRGSVHPIGRDSRRGLGLRASWPEPSSHPSD
eukprot:15444261-Alexandrium_andersonii.AAC.1